MQLLPMTSDQIHVGLRAMKAVAMAHVPFSDEERVLLQAVAETLGADTTADALMPVAPSEIAEAFPDAAGRRQLVQMLIFTAMVDGDTTLDELRIINEFASELGVDEAWVKGTSRLASEHLTMLRLDMLRRIPARSRATGEASGGARWKELWMALRNVAQGRDEPDLAWRFKRLGLLPDGTLGRAYWEHMTRRRLLFAGERGAIYSGVTFHDFMHVLCGYGTDPAGEMEVTAFTAGMRHFEDPFAIVFGALSMWHLGIRLHPIATPEELRFDSSRVRRAFQRGQATRVDLSEHWNFWAVIDHPLGELRELYNIEPAG